MTIYKEDVLEIIECIKKRLTIKSIASRFGVSHQRISQIAIKNLGKNYRKIYYLPKVRITRTCKTCEKLFKVTSSRKDALFCSKTCFGKSRLVYLGNAQERNTQRMRKYYKTDKGRENVKKAVYKSQTKYPHKQKARLLIYYNLKKGYILKPLKCSKCNRKLPLEGHHTDYTKPLEVIWVCRQCHGVLDKEIASIV